MKVALLQVLRRLAVAYCVALQLNRDDDDAEFKRAYRRLNLKVHPDKGGQREHQQELNDAYQGWDKARAGSKRGRRPQNAAEQEEDPGPLANPRAAKKTSRACYRIQGVAVMLTYQGFGGLDAWARFVVWWESNYKSLGVKYWCATLETNTRGNQAFHAHVMIQFTREVDITTFGFSFDGKKRRADANDLLGEGWGGRRFQQSVDRGFFYVWADKIGTVRDGAGKPCVTGNYAPCWEAGPCSYPVPGRWPENLWKERKLTDETYDRYLFLTRDGVVSRKRNLDACAEQRLAKEEEAEMQEQVQRVRGNPNWRPYPQFPEVLAWLSLFFTDRDRFPCTPKTSQTN